jgi:hypothetical protein
MADRTITTDFWTDAEDWTRDQTLVFFYLCTNPQAKICGLYKISVGTIADDTKLDRDAVREALAGLEELGVAYYDHQLVFVKNYAKYQHAEKLGGWNKHLIKAYEDLYKPGNKAAEAFMTRFGDVIDTLLKPGTQLSLKQSKQAKNVGVGVEATTLPTTLPGSVLNTNSNNNTHTSNNSNMGKGGVGENPKPSVQDELDTAFVDLKQGGRSKAEISDFHELCAKYTPEVIRLAMKKASSEGWQKLSAIRDILEGKVALKQPATRGQPKPAPVQLGRNEPKNDVSGFLTKMPDDVRAQFAKLDRQPEPAPKPVAKEPTPMMLDEATQKLLRETGERKKRELGIAES